MVTFVGYDNQVRPLIGSASPRDIPEWKNSISQVYDDKVFAKYYDELTAYQNIKEFFIAFKKYTHLVIWPDDLIIEYEQYMKLRKLVEANNYPVLSGTCNVNWNKKDQFVTCKEMPAETAMEDDYGYLTKAQLDEYKDNPIQPMAFEGFACCFIRRDVIEQIDLQGTKYHRAFDWAFARDCARLNIPIMVDTSVRMLHLGKRMKYPENWGVGFKTPEFRFDTTRGPAYLGMHNPDKYKKMIDSFGEVVYSVN